MKKGIFLVVLVIIGVVGCAPERHAAIIRGYSLDYQYPDFFVTAEAGAPFKYRVVGEFRYTYTPELGLLKRELPDKVYGYIYQPPRHLLDWIVARVKQEHKADGIINVLLEAREIHTMYKSITSRAQKWTISGYVIRKL